MEKKTVKSELEESSLLSPPLSSYSPSTESSFANFSASGFHHLPGVHLKFIQQPPDTLRKSNFFSFSLSLLSSDHQPLTVLSAQFVGFIGDGENGSLRNGTFYKLLIKSTNGIIRSLLFLRLVDSSNKELIAFEGSDKNPDFRRVLLTHTSTCARCSGGKSCGNQKEAPEDPVLEKDGTVLKFFLRCNQNGALTGRPGRPKWSAQRMFQVQVESDQSVLGFSKEFFVHNSSKYGKTAEKANSSPNHNDKECKVNFEPTISSLSPVKGAAGTELFLLGENFTADFDVLLGNVCVKPALMMPCALKVIVPNEFTPGCIKVALVNETTKVRIECPVPFTVTEAQSSLLDQVRVLGQMLPKNFTSKLGRPLTSNIEVLTQVALFIEWFKSTRVTQSSYPSAAYVDFPHNVTMISPPNTPPTEGSYSSSEETSLNEESESVHKMYTILTTSKSRFHPYAPRPPHQHFQSSTPGRFTRPFSQLQFPKSCSQESTASQNFWRPN